MQCFGLQAAVPGRRQAVKTRWLLLVAMVAVVVACEGSTSESEPEGPGESGAELSECEAKVARTTPVVWSTPPPEGLDRASTQHWYILISSSLTCTPPTGSPNNTEERAKAMTACFVCIRTWLDDHGCVMEEPGGNEEGELRFASCDLDTIEALRLHPDVEEIGFDDPTDFGGAGGG